MIFLRSIIQGLYVKLIFLDPTKPVKALMLKYWEIELDLPRDIIPREENWPEEDVDLIDHRLIPFLKHSVDVYPKEHVYANQGGKIKTVKFMQNYEKVCASVIG